MFNLKISLLGLCLVSSAAANNWLASPLRIEADPRMNKGLASARYEATGSAPALFPVFEKTDGKVEIVTLEAAPRADAKTGLYTQTYQISFPLTPVAGERQIPLLYRLGGTGDAKELILVVNTPELTQISDRRLVWGRNSPANSKIVTVALVSPEGYKLTEAITVRGEAVAKIRRDEIHKYSITVTPPDTSSPGRSVIEVKAVGETGQETSFVVYAEVK